MEYRRLGQGRIRCFYMHELQIGIYQREKFSKNTDKNTDMYSDNTRKAHKCRVSQRLFTN